MISPCLTLLFVIQFSLVCERQGLLQVKALSAATPTGNIYTVWVCGLRRSRWRQVPYPGVRAVIQATWFPFQTLEAKAQPSTIKHGHAPTLDAGSISRSVMGISI